MTVGTNVLCSNLRARAPARTYPPLCGVRRTAYNVEVLCCFVPEECLYRSYALVPTGACQYVVISSFQRKLKLLLWVTMALLWVAMELL